MRALLVVDVQNDFLPGGALAVSRGDAILETVNRLMASFRATGDIVVCTADWHPADHVSFAANHNKGAREPLTLVMGRNRASNHT